MALFTVRNLQRKEKVYRQRTDFSAFPQPNYVKLFRFNHENVQWLTENFNLPSSLRGGGLSGVQKMQVFLRYVSDPGFQTGVANDFGISQPVVSKTVWEVCEKIVEKSHEHLKFPVSAQDVANAKSSWYARYSIPNVIGAIDCTHVRIDKPSGTYGDEYINRKGFTSLNVQATCDSTYRFTSMDARWPGSVHDSRIFTNSDLYAHLFSTQNCALLGDSGYGITPFMITPYKNPSTHSERNFNKVHSKDRVIIENSFGILKRRFPMLRYGLRVNLEKIPFFILACMVLHNLAKDLNEPDPVQEEPDDENFGSGEFSQEMRSETLNQLKLKGMRLRDSIAQHLSSN